MANVNNGEKKNKIRKEKIKKILSSIILVLLFLYLVYEKYGLPIQLPQQQEQQTEPNIDTEKELILTMIDVGQGDSFLLIQGDNTALIDCGTRSTGKDVVQYLKDYGIKRLDYVFGTHPHDDHMGGMYDVITNFEIGKIIIPDVKEDIVTNWYLKLMQEVNSGSYIVEHPTAGNVYYLGDASLKVIGPISEPNGNLNNYSTVLKVTFGEMDVIMTGDAETKVEKDIIESGEYIDAEILKVGHHGSDTSTSSIFLDAVNPEYALISCKVGNKYKHPIKIIMDKLKRKNITVYRTDECGTVTAVISPKSVIFDCDPGDYLSGTEIKEREETQ